MMARAWTTIQGKIIAPLLLYACHRQWLRGLGRGPATQPGRRKVTTEMLKCEFTEWWKLVCAFPPHGAGRQGWCSWCGLISKISKDNRRVSYHSENCSKLVNVQLTRESQTATLQGVAAMFYNGYAANFVEMKVTSDPWSWHNDGAGPITAMKLTLWSWHNDMAGSIMDMQLTLWSWHNDMASSIMGMQLTLLTDESPDIMMSQVQSMGWSVWKNRSSFVDLLQTGMAATDPSRK